MALEMSHQQGWISKDILDRSRALCEQAKLPVTLDNAYAIKELGRAAYDEKLASLDQKRFIDLMYMDKKVADGALNLVLLKGELGNSIITPEFDGDILNSIVSDSLENAAKMRRTR